MLGVEESLCPVTSVTMVHSTNPKTIIF